jgi:uncharacterized protein YuzE
MAMKLHFDKEADAVLLILRDGPWHHSRDMGHGVTFDFDGSGELMAISILNLSKRAGRPILEHLNLSFAPELEPVEIETDIELPEVVKRK